MVSNTLFARLSTSKSDLLSLEMARTKGLIRLRCPSKNTLIPNFVGTSKMRLASSESEIRSISLNVFNWLIVRETVGRFTFSSSARSVHIPAHLDHRIGVHDGPEYACVRVKRLLCTTRCWLSAMDN